MATHRFLAPTAHATQTAAECDCVVGWSFGAWRVLEAGSRGIGFRGRVILASPFLAFASEYGLGGRCSRTQVRWLHRWLEKAPLDALRDFATRAELEPLPPELPYALADLAEGLDRLAEDASPALRQFATRGLPTGWIAVIGERDSLLNAAQVAQCLPGCRIVPEAGHRLPALMESLEKPIDAL
jgi:hypothetical protein